jgi:allantoin permease
MPWKLVESATTLYFFYSFIGSMFGPIAGIMLASYYLERRRRLDLDRIYLAPGSHGAYPRGYNTVAVGVLAFSFVCTMSGAFASSVPLLVQLNNFAFFAGLVISFALYLAAVKLRKPAAA